MRKGCPYPQGIGNGDAHRHYNTSKWHLLLRTERTTATGNGKGGATGVVRQEKSTPLSKSYFFHEHLPMIENKTNISFLFFRIMVEIHC